MVVINASHVTVCEGVTTQGVLVNAKHLRQQLQCVHRLDGAMETSLQAPRLRASSFSHDDTVDQTSTAENASKPPPSADRLVPALIRDDAECRPASSEHLAHIARERERLFVRGEVAAVRVRACEDDVMDCVDLAAPRSASTPSVSTGADSDARERRLGQLLREKRHAERERERAHQERFLGRRRVRVLVIGP
jgi:hypothetical protein